jgi:hypothetical protein
MNLFGNKRKRKNANGQGIAKIWSMDIVQDIM